MKALFEQYSSVVISIFCIIALVGILFFGVHDSEGNKGIYNILGAQVERSGEISEPSNDSYNSMASYTSQFQPKIELTDKRVVEKETTPVTDIMTVTDSEGEDAPFDIYSVTITTKSGMEDAASLLADETIDGKRCFTFAKNGTYHITLKVKDRQTSKYTIVKTAIVVNKAFSHIR